VIIIQLGGGPLRRFVPIVSKTDDGVYVAGVALAIIVARQYTIADSGHARVRKGATA
jgi:hypothetical protein